MAVGGSKFKAFLQKRLVFFCHNELSRRLCYLYISTTDAKDKNTVKTLWGMFVVPPGPGPRDPPRAQGE